MDVKDKIKVIPFIVENKFEECKSLECGFANGYVAIPPTNKDWGKFYENIDANIHGGLTYSEPYLKREYLKSKNKPFNKDNWERCLYGKPIYLTLNNEIPDDWWVVGFDTFHYGDNKATCDINFCISETLKLAEQLSKE